MPEAFVIDGVRTVFGKAGGLLAGVRPDDLAAAVLAELLRRSPALPAEAVEDVYWGATNQSGDDSRNVARIAAVLAGLPFGVAGCTVNRLCGSGLEAVVVAARAVKSGELDVCLAGGSESMSRAPFILPRAESAYQRTQPVYDSRLGWRAVNPRWAAAHGARTLVECAELMAERYGVSRAEQDEYAVTSHQRAAAAWAGGQFATETISVTAPDGTVVDRDETVRPGASAESLARLSPVTGPAGSVTAGNASPMNDGAAGLLDRERAGRRALGAAAEGPDRGRRLGRGPPGRPRRAGPGHPATAGQVRVGYSVAGPGRAHRGVRGAGGSVHPGAETAA